MTARSRCVTRVQLTAAQRSCFATYYTRWRIRSPRRSAVASGAMGTLRSGCFWTRSGHCLPSNGDARSRHHEMSPFQQAVHSHGKSSVSDERDHNNHNDLNTRNYVAKTTRFDIRHAVGEPISVSMAIHSKASFCDWSGGWTQTYECFGRRRRSGELSARRPCCAKDRTNPTATAVSCTFRQAVDRSLADIHLLLNGASSKTQRPFHCHARPPLHGAKQRD
jgi:hypothetical protein